MARAPTRGSEGPELVWEKLESAKGGFLEVTFSVHRAKVPGGWLVIVMSGNVTFYPDPDHEWDGGSLR